MNTSDFDSIREQCIEDLRRALQAPPLEEFEQHVTAPTPGARKAAYNLALALGRCRIFGVDVPGDLDGELWPAVAMAAAEQAAQYVRQWADEARTMSQRWDAACPEEAEDIVASTLEARMDAACVMEAVSECYERMLDEERAEHAQPGIREVERALDRLVDALDVFDDVVQEPENLCILSTAVSLPLLENWRRCLAGAYAEAPPWWLDGTLEAVDKEVEKVAMDTLPSPQAWARLRRPRCFRDILRAMPEPVSLAAQSVSAEPDILAVAQWRSPDGRYLADLFFPAQPVVGQVLYLNVVREKDDSEAVELAGQPVVLAGVEGRLDEHARAGFPLDRLLASLDKEPIETGLVVGLEATVWKELPLEVCRSSGGSSDVWTVEPD